MSFCSLTKQSLAVISYDGHIGQKWSMPAKSELHVAWQLKCDTVARERNEQEMTVNICVSYDSFSFFRSFPSFQVMLDELKQETR